MYSPIKVMNHQEGWLLTLVSDIIKGDFLAPSKLLNFKHFAQPNVQKIHEKPRQMCLKKGKKSMLNMLKRHEFLALV